MRLAPSPGFLLATALLGTTLTGCERIGILEPEFDGATLAAVQEQVFNQSCALSGCHVGSQAPMGLVLSTGQAHSNTVGVRSVQVPDLFRIEPGNPGESYLVMKVEGTPGIVGGRMPLGIPPLTDEAIALLRDWILAGAPAD
jgi:hypothetical protein